MHRKMQYVLYYDPKYSSLVFVFILYAVLVIVVIKLPKQYIHRNLRYCGSMTAPRYIFELNN